MTTRMVKLRRLNGSEIVVNAHLIECIEATPDTVLSLTTGRKLMVKDTVEEIVDKVVEYRRSLFPSTVEAVLEAPRLEVEAPAPLTEEESAGTLVGDPHPTAP